MTKQEAAKLMAIIEVAYPAYYRNEPQKKIEAVNLWGEMFADDDTSIVVAAVKSYMAGDTKGFPPSIGQIKAIMHTLTDRMETPTDAWNLVKNALRRASYYSAEEYEKLPRAVKRAVGSANQLKEWAQLDIAEIDTVIAPTFRKAYAAVEEDVKVQAALPGDVKKFLESRMPLQIEGEAI